MGQAAFHVRRVKRPSNFGVWMSGLTSSMWNGSMLASLVIIMYWPGRYAFPMLEQVSEYWKISPGFSESPVNVAQSVQRGQLLADRVGSGETLTVRPVKGERVYTVIVV